MHGGAICHKLANTKLWICLLLPSVADMSLSIRATVKHIPYCYRDTYSGMMPKYVFPAFFQQCGMCFTVAVILKDVSSYSGMPSYLGMPGIQAK